MDIDFAAETYSRIDLDKVAYSASYDEARGAASSSRYLILLYAIFRLLLESHDYGQGSSLIGLYDLKLAIMPWALVYIRD